MRNYITNGQWSHLLGQALHWLVVEVCVGASRCVRSVNKKSDRKAIQVLYTLERHVVRGM